MKRIIRQGCFETNSSSSHSITLITEGRYEALQHGLTTIFDGKIVPAPQTYGEYMKMQKEIAPKFAERLEKYFKDKGMTFADSMPTDDFSKYWKEWIAETSESSSEYFDNFEGDFEYWNTSILPPNLDCCYALVRYMADLYDHASLDIEGYHINDDPTQPKIYIVDIDTGN